MYEKLINHLKINFCPNDFLLENIEEEKCYHKNCVECWEHAIKNIEEEE